MGLVIFTGPPLKSEDLGVRRAASQRIQFFTLCLFLHLLHILLCPPIHLPAPLHCLSPTPLFYFPPYFPRSSPILFLPTTSPHPSFPLLPSHLLSLRILNLFILLFILYLLLLSLFLLFPFCLPPSFFLFFFVFVGRERQMRSERYRDWWRSMDV